jgi:hypothetical protein
MMLTTLQRATGVVVLAGAACILHFGLCRWSFEGGDWERGIWTASREVERNNQSVMEVRGLFSRQGVEYVDGVVFGVAGPLACGGLAVLLLAGWRRAARLGAGRCARCGYDLRGIDDRCPECGDGCRHQIGL